MVNYKFIQSKSIALVIQCLLIVLWSESLNENQNQPKKQIEKILYGHHISIYWCRISKIDFKRHTKGTSWFIMIYKSFCPPVYSQFICSHMNPCQGLYQFCVLIQRINQSNGQESHNFLPSTAKRSKKEEVDK